MQGIFCFVFMSKKKTSKSVCAFQNYLQSIKICVILCKYQRACYNRFHIVKEM